MSQTPHRKLVAIMFTDMVGYSALAQNDEAMSLAVLEDHGRLLRPIFDNHGGHEIKTTGDSFLVVFPNALDAVRCAVEMQRALEGHNTTIAPEKRIEVRIGIHLGDVVYRGTDVFGDAVNIAARIEPLAEPGGICVSVDVKRQIDNKIQLPLEKLDPAKLKNIETEIEVYRVVFKGKPEKVPVASMRITEDDLRAIH